MSAKFSAFIYIEQPNLPPLSWLAIVDGSKRVTIIHGSLVETRERFFVEGAWAGDFSAGHLAASDCMFGSGAEIKDGVLTFVPSIAATDYLFWYQTRGVHYVSNSLPLVLWPVQDTLVPTNFSYADRNQSVCLGMSRWIPDLPTKRGVVKRLMHFNLVFRDSTPVIEDKPLPPPFPVFNDYHAYMSTSLGRCIANARSSARQRPMHVYATQSKGYDSTAVNAMASAFGIDAAFIIKQGVHPTAIGRGDDSKPLDDDGTAVCKALGIDTIPIDRHAHRNGVPDELAYWASMHNNLDWHFAGMHKHIKAPALLLTGSLGELWNPSASAMDGKFDDDLLNGEIGCHGLSEVRLKIGYAQVPAPYIGARRPKDILAISESSEMAPWRLGTHYDRPIARRIAETAGVPRTAFGQAKAAAAVEFGRPNVPLGKELRAEFLGFLRRHRLLSRAGTALLPIVRRYNRFVSFNTPSFSLRAYYFRKLVRRLSAGRLDVGPVWQHLYGSIFCFAVNRAVEHLSETIPLDHAPQAAPRSSKESARVLESADPF